VNTLNDHNLFLSKAKASFNPENCNNPMTFSFCLYRGYGSAAEDTSENKGALRDSFTYQLSASSYPLPPVSFRLEEHNDEVPGAKRLEECFAKWDQLSSIPYYLIAYYLIPSHHSPQSPRSFSCSKSASLSGIHHSPNT
jgi:hypothetical protein